MKQAVESARVDVATLREFVKGKYTEVALEPEKGFHFHTGRPLAEMLGYDQAEIDWLPQATVDSFAGTGNPFSMGALPAAATVLDIGCGAGFDTLLAACQVGPSGHVIALDMTEAMLEKARQGAAALGLTNIEVRHGYAEDLPVDSGSIDVVISNGVINLCPDKVGVMRELYRVLKPGGRFQIADIVVHREVPAEAKEDINLWTGWIAGALLEAEWNWVLAKVGFTDIRWGKQVDVFSGSKHESDAKEFDTRGVTFSGVKPPKPAVAPQGREDNRTKKR